MSDVPETMQGLVPTQDVGGLSPLQLALAQKLATGALDIYKDYPLLMNRQFLNTMAKYCDSGFLSPISYDFRSRFANAPDMPVGLTGISYIIENEEDVYMIRKAQDCGPDENRLEKVLLGKKRELAEGTFAYYGCVIVGGSVANGGGGPWGTGGVLSAYPGPSGSSFNPDTDLATYDDFATSENASAIGSPPDLSLIGNYAGPGGIA